LLVHWTIKTAAARVKRAIVKVRVKSNSESGSEESNGESEENNGESEREECEQWHYVSCIFCSLQVTVSIYICLLLQPLEFPLNSNKLGHLSTLFQVRGIAMSSCHTTQDFTPSSQKKWANPSGYMFHYNSSLFHCNCTPVLAIGRFPGTW
jgi:hypothetical protein